MKNKHFVKPLYFSNIISYFITIMWGKKAATKFSKFFEGKSIFDVVSNSVFGQFKQVITEFFSDNEQQYTLPKVIVIGNESTGKSSLLENITKCQIFPRNISLCTKCPVHLKLITGVPEYSIAYLDQVTKEKKNITLKDKTLIYQELLKIFNAYSADVIYEDEIVVTIKDVNMPNFEFYDLPGIRSYPPVLAEKTTSICRKYLQDKNSIVICVVPATTTSLTSCQSIALVIETHMQHNCILALTMADRLQPENVEDLLIKRILKTSDEVLGLNFAGYTAIVNRSHTDNKSLIENDDYEIAWFNENIMQPIPAEYAAYIPQIQDSITISRLLKNIDDLYNKFISTEWKPRVIKDINTEIAKITASIDELGPQVISRTDFLKAFEQYVHAELESAFLAKTKAKFVFVPDSDIVPDYKKYNIVKTNINVQSYPSNIKSKIITHITTNFCGEKYSDKKYYKFTEGTNTIIKHINNYRTSENDKIVKTIITNFVDHLYVTNSAYSWPNIKTKIDELYDLHITYPMLDSCVTLHFATDHLVENEVFANKRTLYNNKLQALQKNLAVITNIDQKLVSK